MSVLNGLYRYAPAIESIRLSNAAKGLLSTTALFATPTSALVSSIATGILIGMVILLLQHYYANKPSETSSNKEQKAPAQPKKQAEPKGQRPFEAITSKITTPFYPQVETILNRREPPSHLSSRSRPSRRHQNMLKGRFQRRQQEVQNYRAECKATDKEPSQALIEAIRKGSVTYPKKLAEERIGEHLFKGIWETALQTATRRLSYAQEARQLRERIATKPLTTPWGQGGRLGNLGRKKILPKPLAPKISEPIESPALVRPVVRRPLESATPMTPEPAEAKATFMQRIASRLLRSITPTQNERSQSAPPERATSPRPGDVFWSPTFR